MRPLRTVDEPRRISALSRKTEGQTDTCVTRAEAHNGNLISRHEPHRRRASGL